jgi:hypothetical protein
MDCGKELLTVESFSVVALSSLVVVISVVGSPVLDI